MLLHSGTRVIAVLLVALACTNAAPFPLADTVQLARSHLVSAPTPIPTGLTKEDYLQTLSSIVGYFRTKLQNAAGVIIDPFTGPREVQYGTPTFAYAAIVQGLVTHDDVTLTAGIRALNISLQNLIDNRCADSHCNFFTLPLMLSIEALQPHVSAGLYSFYLAQANRVATSRYINNDINWGIVAAVGDYIRYLLGQTNTNFFENIFSQHLRFFSSNGMYQDATPSTNPSTTYDIFPRLYLEYALLRGYSGPSAAALTEFMERGALASLLLQSPHGENPTGGRSSQHQWNEAVLVFLFELRANKYKAAGDMVMASAFKRGARLAHRSIRKWFTPEGYLYVVKNRMNPALRFGYEIYSHLTNYNGLPACFLAMAYTIADDTIPEGPSFAETGGYAMEVPAHRKIVANVKGNYFEWETMADPNYDSTGLTRIHHPNTHTLIGPAAATSIVSGVSSNGGALNVGIAWTKGNVTESLAQFGTGKMGVAYLNVTTATPTLVECSITYPLNGSLVGVTQVVETVTLTANKITIATTLDTSVDTVEFRYPVFLYDGVYNSSFDVVGNKVNMYGGVPATYSVENPAGVTLTYSDVNRTNRNGYLGVATATVPATESEYVISIEHCIGCFQNVTYTVGFSGDFPTIGAALNAVKSLSGVSNYVLEIEAGTYAEKVVVDTPNGILLAKSSPVIISHHGTSDSDATLTITAQNVRVYDLTVINTRAQSAGIGSSLAINPSATSQTSFYKCSFYGFRNTVVFQNSFVLAYFKNSYIEGGTDMIIGAGTAYFDECTLASNGPGSVTTMSGVSTSNTDKWVFNYVTLVATTPSSIISSHADSNSYTSSAQFAAGNFLGRPGDSFSRVVFMFSNLGSHVSPQGWASAGNYFAEFQNFGPSAFGRERTASARLLTGEESAPYTLDGVLGGTPILLPQWIDANFLPGCAAIYGFCQNDAAFAVPRCCRPSLSCVEQTSEFSMCFSMPLSPRSYGQKRVHQSGTFGVKVIYVHNPWGPVSYSYNSTTLLAYFDALLYDAVGESVLTTVTSQMTPITALNISIDYSSRSDPRGAGVGLHITLPSDHPIQVINVTPNPPTHPPTDPPTSPPTTSTPPPFPPTGGWYVSSTPSLCTSVFALLATVMALLL